MRKYILILSLILMPLLFWGAGTVYFVQNTVSSQAMSSGTYANSAVDTIFYARQPGLVGLALSAHWKDSVGVTNAILRRVIGGELMAVQTGDTLFTVADSNTVVAGVQGSAANPSFADSKTITLTPQCDMFRIIVTYASSKNGVSNNKVDYIFQQQFYTR